MEQNKKIIPIFSLLTTLSFAYLNSMSFSVLLFVLMLPAICFFYYHINIKKDWSSILLSIFLSFLLILGKYIIYLDESGGIELAIKLIVTPLGSYLFFRYFSTFLFDKLDNYQILDNNKLSFKKIFLISFGLIIVSWIPTWIAEYPGIFTPDTISQLGQSLGYWQYNTMNPLLHTLLLKLMYWLASLFFNDINKQSFLVGFMQMVVNSLIYAYATAYIYKRSKSLPLTIGSILFFAFASFNVFYNISISKDSAYAAFTVLLVVFIEKYMQNPNKKNGLILIVVGILYSLMRNNGYYSLILVFGIMLIMMIWKNLRKTLVTVLAILILCTIIKIPVYNSLLKALNSEEETTEVKNYNSSNKYIFRGNFIYVLPFQQVANVVVHGRELNEKEEWLIEEYIDLEKVAEVYNPILVDPLFDYITNHVKPTRANISNLEYIKLWIELFFKYPLDYLEAYINMNKYYFYPSRYVNMYYIGIADNSFGIEQSDDISSNYKETIENIYNSQKDIPILGSIYSPGVTTFILITALFYSLRRKNISSFISLFPLFANFAILMLFVPLNDEFRYIYPVVVCLPLILMHFFIKDEDYSLLSEGGNKQ